MIATLRKLLLVGPTRRRRPTARRVLIGLAVTWLGALRCLIGLVMLADPTRLARTLDVDHPPSGEPGWPAQMIGAREIAIGAGGLLAVRRREHVNLWCSAALLADATDVVAVATGIARHRVKRLAGGLFVAFAVAGVAADVTVIRHLGPTSRER